MKIKDDSMFLLDKLYTDLVENENSDSLLVHVNLNKYKEDAGFSINYIRLLLDYLLDSGYIYYDSISNDNSKIKLTHVAIDFIES